MKNPKHTHLDTNQILSKQYDEDNDAQRVTIVASEAGDIGKNISDAISAAISGIKLDIPLGMGQQQPIVIEKPVIHEVIKEVQVPIIQEKIVYIDKPVIVTDVQVIEKPMIIEKVNTVIEYIEKPVIIIQEKIVESKQFKILSIIQTIAIVAMVLSLFIKRG